MALDLSARFRMIDEMSDKLDNISTSGEKMVDTWSKAEQATQTAVDSISDGASRAARAIEEAAGASDHWTAAASRYDKSALEAVHSTEELVDMGLKSAKALEEQQEAAAAAAENYDFVAKALSNAEDAQSSLMAAQREANKLAEKMAQSDLDTLELQQRIAAAQQEAKTAQEELTAAQAEANAAIEEYNKLVESGNGTTEQYAAAADKAWQAEDKLSQSAQKAADATDNLGKETKETSEEFKKVEDSGGGAFNAIAAALESVGIAKKISEITEEVYKMTTAMSDAESTIVTATGATGASLDGLSSSMMDTYQASKTGSMADTAAAVGEINTRMHLQGEELEYVTEKFLDYSDITGANVTNSVRDVTQIMNKWHIENENVVDVLDKLAYASQISGAKVDGLSSSLITGAAQYQALDLSLDNTISLLAQFELAGINSSTAMMGMRTAVSKFAQDGQDAKTALIDVITQISTMEDKTKATALAVDTFGTRAGQELALAIQSGILTVDTFTASMDDAQGTLERTAEAAQTLSEKQEQASNSMSAAFTNAFGPTVEKVAEGIFGVTDAIGDFLYEHEEYAKVISAVATGVVVATTAITGYVFITNVAIPAVKALTVALAGMSRAGWIAIVATAVVAAGVALAAMLKDTNEEYESWSATTRNQYDRLQELNAEYERTCELYGETSAEAVLMKQSVDDATAAFEANKMTSEELNAILDDTHNRFAEVSEAYISTNEEIATEQEVTRNLTDRLRELTSTSERAAGSQHQIEAIARKLNDMFPELGINIENVNGDIDELIGKIEGVSNANTREAAYQNAAETYANLLPQKDDLEKAYSMALKEWNKMAMEQEALYTGGNVGQIFVGMFGGGIAADVKEAENAMWRAEQDLAAYEQQMAECIAIMEEYEAVMGGTSSSSISAAEGVQITLNNTQTATEELIATYQEAYNAAYDSISGQMGLFEQMAISCETSTDEMIAALKSQSDYVATYTENLRNAAQYGLDEGLIASLSDGSQESAGYINAIIDKIDELGADSAEAKAFIDEMNSSFTDTQAAKDEFADTVANMETGFASGLDLIAEDMKNTIDTLNMSEEAADAAKATIDAYIEALKSGTDGVTDAASLIAAASAAAFGAMPVTNGRTSTNLPTYNGDDFQTATRGAWSAWGIPTYASGTTNAADVAIVGENGTELMIDHGGATVFPTSETDRIIAAVNDTAPLFVGAPSPEEFRGAQHNAHSETTKRIQLDINGAGSITVEGGTDKANVLEILTENIKPVLMSILNAEIFEEGEGVYDY